MCAIACANVCVRFYVRGLMYVIVCFYVIPCVVCICVRAFVLFVNVLCCVWMCVSCDCVCKCVTICPFPFPHARWVPPSCSLT